MVIVLIIALIVILILILLYAHDEKLIDGYKNMLGMTLHELEQEQNELSEYEKEDRDAGIERELEKEI